MATMPVPATAPPAHIACAQQVPADWLHHSTVPVLGCSRAGSHCFCGHLCFKSTAEASVSEGMGANVSVGKAGDWGDAW